MFHYNTSLKNPKKKFINSSFFNKDPTYIIFLLSIKFLITIILYIILANFVFYFSTLNIIWGCFFLSFVTITCSIGEIKIRRLTFFLYTISFILFLLLISFASSNKFISYSIIIFSAYFIFWIRRFGNIFLVFPIFVYLCGTVSAYILTIPVNLYLEFIFSSLLASFLFFIIVLGFKPFDNKKQLFKLNIIFSYLLMSQSSNRLEKIIDYYDDKNSKIEDFYYEDLSEKAGIFLDEGDLLIVKNINKKNWHNLWSNWYSVALFNEKIFKILININKGPEYFNIRKYILEVYQQLCFLYFTVHISHKNLISNRFITLYKSTLQKLNDEVLYLQKNNNDINSLKEIYNLIVIFEVLPSLLEGVKGNVKNII